MFPLVVSRMIMSLYGWLQGQDPAWLGGFARSTSPSRLTSSEAHTWCWRATKTLLMIQKVLEVSKKRSEGTRVFVWSTWSSFWPFSVFQICQIEEAHLNQPLEEWRTSITQPFISAPFPFSSFSTVKDYVQNQTHLPQINVNRCTKSCIKVKY